MTIINVREEDFINREVVCWYSKYFLNTFLIRSSIHVTPSNPIRVVNASLDKLRYFK